MNLYHFTPCVSADNDINSVGLEKALYRAANNSYVKMDPKTAIIAYLIVNIPEKFLNMDKFTEEGINKIFNKWKKDNITGNAGIVSLAYAKTEKETFDVMLLLGGFDLRPTIEKYWQEYKSLKKTLMMASEGGHIVDFGNAITGGNLFEVKEIEQIEDNLTNYLTHTEKVFEEKSRELKEQQKLTCGIEIRRGYVLLQDNNIRFGVRVINNSEFTISDVEVLLHYDESLFDLENKIKKLGTIPPTVPRTAEFVLKPRGCIHKEELGATILYKDHHYKKYLLEMSPKEVHCVHPFLKEKAITQTEFLALSKSGYSAEIGVNFENIDAKLMSTFFMQTYRKKFYKVSEYTINNEIILYLSGESIGDKIYYLLTAVVKEYEGLTQIILKANSDKPHGLNSLLNDEILENLRHLVKTVKSAREIGVIKKEQVINIINSVVQRTTFAGGEGGTSVNIKDSVVQHMVIKGDEEKLEEKLRKGKEIQAGDAKALGYEERKELQREKATPFEEIWSRIVINSGELFHTKTGLEFTYKIEGDRFYPSRTDYSISKTDFRTAYELVPIDGPGVINDTVRGPAYVWAVLHDQRISNGEW